MRTVLLVAGGLVAVVLAGFGLLKAFGSRSTWPPDAS
jgi:hypothetical protein